MMRIVVLGGGFAGLEAVRGLEAAFRTRALRDVQLVLERPGTRA